MIRGLYTAATGMIAEQYVQDTLAGNLANINTIGYKQDTPTFRAVQEMALSRYDCSGQGGTSIGRIGLGVAFDHTSTNLHAGSLVNTHNPLDLALSGSGFFSVQTPDGERYTRAGQFHLEPAGKGPDGKAIAYIQDDQGNRVLGLKGAINVGDAREISVSEKGDIQANGVVIDRLKLVDGPAGAFEKSGNSVLTLTGQSTPATALVKSGYLEQSNVSAIGSMVRMIAVQRAYESAQRAITSQDETLGKAVNEVGRA